MKNKSKKLDPEITSAKTKKKRPDKKRKTYRRAPFVDAMGNPRKRGAHTSGGAIDKRFDDNVLDAIEKALKLGLTKSIAASHGGISPDTFNRWMAEGSIAKEGTRACIFYVKMTNAVNLALSRHMMVINRASWEKGDARVAQWYLEKMTKEFEPKVHIGGISETPIEVDVTARGKSLEVSLKAILKKRPDLTK